MEDDFLFKIIELNNCKHMDFFLNLDDVLYQLTDVSIQKSPNPVSKITSRGGVYLSDKYSYRMKGTIYDTKIIPQLSKTMLGPNTDFVELKITATLPDENKKLSIYTHLTNSMNNYSKIELNMIIIQIKRD